MLRIALLLFGWLSLLGSLADGIILAYHLVLVAAEGADLFLSVGGHIRAHLPALAWLIPLAEWLLPGGWAPWLFALPAIAYFPARIAFSVVTGGMALDWAEKIKRRSLQKGPGSVAAR